MPFESVQHIAVWFTVEVGPLTCGGYSDSTFRHPDKLNTQGPYDGKGLVSNYERLHSLVRF